MGLRRGVLNRTLVIYWPSRSRASMTGWIQWIRTRPAPRCGVSVSSTEGDALLTSRRGRERMTSMDTNGVDYGDGI
jgi:hypothetical protein